MPEATHLQGWFPLPAEIHYFRASLENLPSPVATSIANVRCQCTADGPTHFFTDGSCLRPKDRFARICGWGVTAAFPDDLWDFRPIASGCLPGRHQTVIRAELTAAAVAAREATQHQLQFCLWSDNQRVVSLLQEMTSHPDKLWSSKVPNHDLINNLADEMRQAAALCKGVFKVMSHQQIQNATCAAERWCFEGNSSADALASQAFQSQPMLMQKWDTLCNQLDLLRVLRKGFQ